METTNYAGINYAGSNSNANKDKKNNIRYGVINQNKVGNAWFDESEPYYGDLDLVCPNCDHSYLALIEYTDCPECDSPNECDCIEPVSFFVDDKEYSAECSCDDSMDIFIQKSPYFTYAQFCSPCAPGACHLENPLDHKEDNNKAYCLGHDWFESGKAPYPVYSVKTGQLIEPGKE